MNAAREEDFFFLNKLVNVSLNDYLLLDYKIKKKKKRGFIYMRCIFLNREWNKNTGSYFI